MTAALISCCWIISCDCMHCSRCSCSIACGLVADTVVGESGGPVWAPCLILSGAGVECCVRFAREGLALALAAVMWPSSVSDVPTATAPVVGPEPALPALPLPFRGGALTNFHSGWSFLCCSASSRAWSAYLAEEDGGAERGQTTTKTFVVSGHTRC